MTTDNIIGPSIVVCVAFANASVRLYGGDGAERTYPEYQAAVRYLNARPDRIDRVTDWDRFASAWLRRAANPLPEQPVRPCDW